MVKYDRYTEEIMKGSISFNSKIETALITSLESMNQTSDRLISAIERQENYVKFLSVSIGVAIIFLSGSICYSVITNSTNRKD